MLILLTSLALYGQKARFIWSVDLFFMLHDSIINHIINLEDIYSHNTNVSRRLRQDLSAQLTLKAV